MQPLVSIIVPCYNQTQFLNEALESVISQIFQNWECIIINDGSPDNTDEIARSWVLRDNRFKYFFKPNGGLVSARNFGIEKSLGEYILPLDADDKIKTNYLESAIQIFKQNKNLKLIYCKAEKFGSETGEWKLPSFNLKRLCLQNMIFCSAIYKKKDWEKVGGYDVNMNYGLEDWEFWIALLKNGGEVKRINEVCFFYRVKKVSMITSVAEDKKNKMLNYISIKHADFYVKQLGSFQNLQEEILALKSNYKNNMKSKKYIFKLILKEFFKINILAFVIILI